MQGEEKGMTQLQKHEQPRNYFSIIGSDHDSLLKKWSTRLWSPDDEEEVTWRRMFYQLCHYEVRVDEETTNRCDGGMG